MIVGYVQPLPFEGDFRPERVRVRPHVIVPHLPTPTELQCQPVLTISEIATKLGWGIISDDEDVGQRITREIGEGEAGSLGEVGEPERMDFETLAVVSSPVNRPFVASRGKAHEVGPGVEIEVARSPATPRFGVRRPGHP